MDIIKFVDYSITACFDVVNNKISYRLTHFLSYRNITHVVFKKEYEDLKSYEEALEKHKEISRTELWEL